MIFQLQHSILFFFAWMHKLGELQWTIGYKVVFGYVPEKSAREKQWITQLTPTLKHWH